MRRVLCDDSTAAEGEELPRSTLLETHPQRHPRLVFSFQKRFKMFDECSKMLKLFFERHFLLRDAAAPLVVASVLLAGPPGAVQTSTPSRLADALGLARRRLDDNTDELMCFSSRRRNTAARGKKRGFCLRPMSAPLKRGEELMCSRLKYCRAQLAR